MAKQLRLRRDGSCAACGLQLVVGQTAVWFPDERVVRCTGCAASTTIEPVVDPVRPSAGPAESSPGGSAQREYHRRSVREQQKKQARVDEDAAWRSSLVERRPILGRIAAAVVPRPQIGSESQATRAWKVGAEGERRVAEVLSAVPDVEVLHDRRIPGSSANIDHVVVGPGGVFVVDAKKYSGRVEVRDKGRLFRPDHRLYVNGRDRTSMVEGVLRQVEVVRSALATAHIDVEVHGVLCFVGCEWGLFMKPKSVRGVTAVWPLRLADHVAVSGPHGPKVPTIAEHLRRRLPPAS